MRTWVRILHGFTLLGFSFLYNPYVPIIAVLMFCLGAFLLVANGGDRHD